MNREQLIKKLELRGYSVENCEDDKGGWGNRLGYGLFLEEDNSLKIKNVYEKASDYTGENCGWLEDTSISEMIENNHTEVIDFFRFELGQGIEDKLSCKLNLPCEGSIIEIK